jgi:hypothetical protein
MAGSHGGADPRGHPRWPDRVCPDRRREGVEPERGSDVYRAEAAQLGAPEAQAGYVSPMDIYDGDPWTELDIEDLRAEIEHGRSIEEAAQFLCRADSIDECRAQGTRVGAYSMTDQQLLIAPCAKPGTSSLNTLSRRDARAEARPRCG